MSDQRAYIELIEARRFIEIGAATLAAKNATPDQIMEILGIVREIAKAAQESGEGKSRQGPSHKKDLAGLTRNSG